MTAGIAQAGSSLLGQGLVGSTPGLQSVAQPIQPPAQDVERFRQAMGQVSAPQAPEAAQGAPQADRVRHMEQTGSARPVTGGDRILQSLDRMRAGEVSPMRDIQNVAAEVNRIVAKPSVNPGDLLRVQAQMISLGEKYQAFSAVQRNLTQDLDKVIQAQ